MLVLWHSSTTKNQLVEQKRYKELDDLSNAYQDNKNVLKKINEIKSGLIKQSKNPDNTKL